MTTFAEQVANVQKNQEPTAPQTQDSPVATPTPEQDSAPVQDSSSPASTAPSDVAPEDSVHSKLADAEKRIRDTQAWGHAKAQEAAKLRSELNALFNHPVFGQLLRAGMEDEVRRAPGQDVDPEIKAAWLEYQSAPNDEAAFQKLLTFAERRAARRAAAYMQRMQRERDVRAAVIQRNRMAAQTVEETVSQVAPDIPLPLFWAMAPRAELETPPEIKAKSWGEQIEWQTNRAIELARDVLRSKISEIQKNQTTTQAVTRSGQVMMPSGGTPPATGGSTSGPTKSFVEQIKERQRKIWGATS